MNHSVLARHLVRWVMVALVLCMAGCVTTRPPATPGSESGSLSAISPHATVREDGPTVERHLRSRFAETFDGCKASSGVLWPTFLCSGILMRGTGDYGAFYPWNPKPGSDVSFVWLRQDSNFLGSWVTNGFIFLPKFYADKFGDYSIHVNCAFADDSYTWIRGNRGCGATSSYPGESGPCHTVGVTTAEQYRAKYQPSNWFNERICGFDMRQASGLNTREAFYQMRRVMSMMGGASFNRWNELVVAEWPQNQAKLPLEAFYYISNPTKCGGGGTSPCPPWTKGREWAQRDQRNLVAVTGRWIPIIRITLAASVGAPAGFVYDPADQGLAP